MILQFVTNSKKPKPGGPVIPTPTDQSFNFPVLAPAYTSAIIQKNGKKVRNVFGGVQRDTGVYNFPFDGQDDEGKSLPAGTYDVPRVTHNINAEWEGVIGNYSTAKTGATKHRGFQFYNDAFVIGDTIVWTRNYDEGWSPISKSNVNSLFERTRVKETFQTNATAAAGCTDGTLMFVGGTDSFAPNKISFVWAFNPIDDSEIVFSAGAEYSRGVNIRKYKSIINPHVESDDISSSGIGIGVNPIISVASTANLKVGHYVSVTPSGGSVQFNGAAIAGQFLQIRQILSGTTFSVTGTTTGTSYTSATVTYYIYAEITGMAVNSDFLFVARESLNTITVLNRTTYAVVNTIASTAPQKMDCDPAGNLWVNSSNTTTTKYSVGVNGALTSLFTVAGIVRPVFVKYDPFDDLMIIGDGNNGNDVYKGFNLAGVLQYTEGVGSSSLDPNVANDKFMFYDRNTNAADNTFNGFIACHADGSKFIGDSGNYRVIKVNAAREYVLTTGYIPHSYSVQVDINDPTRVFNEYMEFEIDYSKPLLPDNQSWTLVRNYRGAIPDAYHAASMKDVFKSVCTFPTGKTYAFLKHKTTFIPKIFELPLDGPITEVNTITFGVHETVSFNSNGDILSTELGTTTFTLYKRSRTGAETWGAKTALQTLTIDRAKDPVNFIEQRSGQQTSNGNYIISNPEGSQQGRGGEGAFHVGGYYNNEYVFKSAPSTTINYDGPFPTDGRFDIGNRVQAPGAGGDLAVCENIIITPYRGEFWKNTQTNYYQVWSQDGHYLFMFGTHKTNFSTEAPEKLAGNAFSAKLVKVGSDMYLYTSDESIHAGIHRWKITGLDTIEESTTTVTITGDVVPDPELPPTNFRTGLNTTAELKAWKDRYNAKKPFYAKSDVKTNSPGIVSEMTILANQLLAYPYIDRFTGPTYYKIEDENGDIIEVPLSPTDYIRQNSYPEPGNKGSKVKAAAILAAAGETKYIPAIKTAILDFIAQPINQFPDHSSAWPANGTRWKPNEIGDINPLFIYAQYFKKYIEAYDLIRDSFTSTQKTAIEDCFYAFAKYGVRETNADLSTIWTNRNPETNKHATGYIWNGDWTGSQRKMFDGVGTPKASKVSLYENNRREELLLTGLTMGILKNDDYLISSAYVFVKEWLKFGCYPWNGEVLPGELERARESNFNDKGVSYSLVQVGLATAIAHYIEIYKKNPVTGVEYPSLFGYSTSEGYAPSGGYSSVGGPKSIGKVGKSVLKLVNGELNLTYNGVKLDGYRESPLWHFTEDTTLAGALYAYYKDPWFEKSALRAHPGSRPFPAGGQGSGAYKPYEGFGGGDWWLFTRFFYDTQTSLY